MADEKAMTKVKDLTPECKQVNVLAKVVSVGEAREIPSKFGKARTVAEATVGDETATVVLSLWQDQIGSVVKDDVIMVDNGFVSLVRGKMRLNVGKYGKLSKSEQPIETVNAEVDMSAKEYPQESRPFRRDFGGRGRDRDRGFGDRDRGGGGFGDRDREKRKLRF
jgi:replication factor A1